MFYASSGSSDPASSLDASRIDALRKELEGVKEQLEETKGELYESQEAHEASELCVKALRTFISENNVGLPMSHNPSGRTSSMSSASEEGKKYGSASRWGFKLWSSTDVQTNITALPVSTDRSASEPATTQTVSSKLGGFFGTRTSISSTSSSSRPPVRPIHQEPMYNGSDTSSIADSATEPVSPEPEVHEPVSWSMARNYCLVNDDGEVMKSSHSPAPPS
ncbi:hypothetical protein A0H81_13518 [Grifola frondosa]|uniref:Uncharacterized protein n=1 Tax=Grifola frondosa TaxID=5627 RepID=A0A1C7LP78_GRIFR|nr:hypothetical protein A0H81_13518 [Grifola frondosa]